MIRYKTMLTIAGSDSGGGAGIQADIKTASACGVFATSVITSLTAQNTQGVKGIHVVPAPFVEMQAEAVLDDIGADAIKLGMLPSPEIVEVVARLIEKYRIENVVLDPVMIATSGDRLISQQVIEAIITRLLPLVRVVTPNIPEAEFITGVSLGAAEAADYQRFAQAFFDRQTRAVLLKSGHREAAEVEDRLFDGTIEKSFGYPYVKTLTRNTHGTGCTLSSAIASFLALGDDLPQAVGRAEDYIHAAVAAGAEYTLGKGHGPVHHFWNF
ncbi:MAG: bifunctional hydroxymethylpyrimidine kinase/phosphomethylpyrimidine kinase [Rikenellaceae bacterium]|jgi:hydroxymethylpyrimidine/phosphomethylpyrimidine kinase|nr:bifunctional hydroxymethylpyrimidine kinase/phosphomethylpyrimidine kinase [Rikenellaceae bacterium]